MVASPPGGQQRRLVEQVFQIGAGEAGGGFGNHTQIHIGGQRLAAGVYLQDFLTALDIGIVDHDLPVETAGTG